MKDMMKQKFPFPFIFTFSKTFYIILITGKIDKKYVLIWQVTYEMKIWGIFISESHLKNVHVKFMKVSTTF